MIYSYTSVLDAVLLINLLEPNIYTIILLQKLKILALLDVGENSAFTYLGFSTIDLSFHILLFQNLEMVS